MFSAEPRQAHRNEDAVAHVTVVVLGIRGAKQAILARVGGCASLNRKLL